ncbi:TPA: multidrug effflux MFS transporter [Vibrio vulnificus]|nr:multidrug effflux MFS transporter [Vibrio vulnificus]HDY7721489.1 multidrug effflux MFS transporter [Vibrio vulnificus]HDY7748735.1 multidrug effflux MFS transporter [Vibrio vulnificus]HDY7756543.1 multidrug effflux MFS transporter [Vibrio vulnificus]HDY7760960.1 multidrug effflux MFS transporter [Vibrio vulnificus]
MINNNMIKYLILLVVFFPMTIDIYLPAFPSMAISLDASSEQLKNTVGFFLVGFGLGQLVLGKFVDLWGSRVIALSGILSYFFLSMVQYKVNSIDWMTYLRFLTGVATAATYVSMMAIIKDNYDSKTMPRILNFMNGAVCCIPVLAPILGSYLTEHYGWRANFSFMALYAVFSLAILYNKLPETNIHSSALNKVSYFKILSNKTFLLNSIMSMSVLSIVFAYVSNAPSWLIGTLGLSSNTFSLWFSANGIVNVLSNLFIAPYLLRRYEHHNLLLFGLIIIIFSGFFMYNAPSTAVGFMLPILSSSFGLAMIVGIISSHALIPFPNNAGSASALLGCMQMAGGGVLVTLIQKLNLGVINELTIHMLLALPFFVLLFVVKFSKKNSADRIRMKV